MASTAHTGSIATSTNALQIGGDSLYGQYFAGMIDEVRVYNTAVTAAQIQADQAAPVTSGPPDTTPPTQPGTLSATAASSSEVDLSWGASTDNVGGDGLPGRALSGRGLQQLRADRHGGRHEHDATSDTRPCRRRATATACGPPTPRAISVATRTPRARRRPRRTRRRRRAGHPDGDGGVEQCRSISPGRASTDNVGVTGYRVERCQGAGCSTFAQIATPARHDVTRTPALSGATSYSYRVRATDAAGNLQPAIRTPPARRRRRARHDAADARRRTLGAPPPPAAEIDLAWTRVDRQRRR